jgi:hypothetical protein
MFEPELKRLVRKALVLGFLVTSLTVLSSGLGTRDAMAAADCCSSCDPGLARCYTGCRQRPCQTLECRTNCETRCEEWYTNCVNTCNPSC